MSIALDIALGDIGLWGAGVIVAGTVIALKVADRARLAAPQRQPQPDARPAEERHAP